MDIKRTLWQMAVLALFASACSKKAQPPVIPVQPPANQKLTRLEFDNRVVEVSYLGEKIQKVTNTFLPTNDQGVETFVYDGDKLVEVISGGRWKYYYTDGKLNKIETYSETGEHRYLTMFIWSGNLVTERIQAKVTTAGIFPERRSFFTYHPNGNLMKQEIQLFVNGGWRYEEHILFPSYDDKPNYSLPFETHPYTPATVFGGNNPLKEIYMEGNTVQEVIEHTYTYDAQGRPKSRVSVHKPTNHAEYTDNLKLFY